MSRAAAVLAVLALALPAGAQTGIYTMPGGGEAGGSSVVLDFSDDGTNESTGLLELAVTGDSNAIFTEPTADKLLINVGQAWPQCDAATTVPEAAVTAHQAALSILWAQLSGVPLTFTPTLHAAAHEAGGADEVSALPAGATVGGTAPCLSDGTDCPADDDNQAAPEVPYTPTTGADWTDPDPTEVGGALDDVAGRVVALETGGSGLGGSTGGVDNAILLANGTGGSTVQSSVLTVADTTGNLTVPLGWQVDLADTGARNIRFTNDGSAADYFEMIVNASTVQLRNGAGNASGLFIDTQNGPLVLRPTSGADFDVRPGSTSRFTVGDTETTIKNEQINAPASQTCASSGDANPGFLSAVVTGASFIAVTNSDPDGCAMFLLETGASNGQAMTVAVVSSAGGTVDLIDSAGVQETGAGCAMALYGTARLVYSTTAARWMLTGCEPTN